VLKNKTIRYLVIFALTINCLQGLHAQKIPLLFDKFDSEQGLSQNSVTAMAQDTLGYIWLGTENGLNKFNGYQITTYFHNIDSEFSILPGSIKDIVVDKYNQLWIANRGGLNCFNQELDEFYAYWANNNDSLSIPCNTVNCLLIDSEDFLWVGTSKGLSRTVSKISKTNSKTHLAFKSLSAKLSDKQILFLYEDFEKNIWVGTENGLNKINRKTGSVKQFFPLGNNKNKNGENGVLAIIQDSKFRFWIGTRNGLFWFNEEIGMFTDLKKHPYFQKNKQANYIKTIFIDHLNRVFIGTYGGGLLLFSEKDNKFYTYTRQANNYRSIANNTVFQIIEDKSKTLFVSTPGNGFCTASLNNKGFRTISKDKNSLNKNTVREIFYQNKNALWIGLQKNGLDKFDIANNTFTNYDFASLKTNGFSPTIKAICAEDSVNLWLGTISQGLILFNTKSGKYSKFPYPNNNAKTNIRYIFDLAADRNGNLWIVSLKDGLFKLDAKRENYTHYSNNNDKNYIAGNDLTSVYVDTKNRIWITSLSNGFFVLDQLSGEIENFREKNQTKTSLISNLTTTVYEAENNIFWIGTSLGLCRFDYNTKEIENYTRKNGLKNEFINSIEDDHNGHLWLSTNNGLSRFNIQKKVFVNFDVKDGLQSNEFNIGASTHMPDGTLLFGGIKGFNIFKPGRITFSKFRPRVTISNFRLFNKQVKINKKYNGQTVLSKSIVCTDTIQLSYKDNFISFEFSANDYSNAKAIQYSYRLTGFEQEWNTVPWNKRLAVYTNLEPGTYIFQVKSTNADGIRQDNTQQIVIFIKPPFWQTSWFLVLFSIFIVSAIVFIFFISNRWIIKQNKKLEQDVAKRTTTIEYKNIELADKITEINKQKEELEEHTKQLEELNSEMEVLSVVIREMKNSLSVLDPSGNLIFSNKAFNEIYNLSPKQIAEKYENNIFKAPFPEHIIKIIRRCFQEKTTVQYEIDFAVGEQGEKVWVHSNITPIISKNGDLKNVIIIDTDITEIKQREIVVLELAEQLQAKAEDLNLKNTELENKNIKITEQSTELKSLTENLEVTNKNLEVLVSKRTKDLKIAKEQAEKANQLKTIFLSNLSHEIRTPMNAICGFASLMGEKNIDLNSRKKYSEIINDNVDSLLILVDNIMDLSKLQAKQIKLNNYKINIVNKLTEIYYLYVVDDNYIKPNVEFKLNLEGVEQIEINTDEKRFKQIFTNLIDNAIKYTEKGNVVLAATIKNIEYDLSGKPELRKILYITVEDTGIGIKREEINKIFEHFRTIDDKIKLYRGTGLGLAIVQELLKIYNWEINVESTLGKGSKFTIKIPL
jgi:PAS domain S-box-containing protein